MKFSTVFSTKPLQRRIFILSMLLWLAYGGFVNLAVSAFVILLCLLAFYVPVLIIYSDDLSLILTGVKQDELKTKVQESGKNVQVSIPKNVDESLENFLDQIILKFIHSWHSKLDPDDQNFLQEIRLILQLAVCRLVQRINVIDWPAFISQKIIPSLILHVDCYVQCKQTNKQAIEQRVLLALGRDVHTAVTSRKSEEHYLRTAAGLIVKKLLPEQYQTSKLLVVIIRELLSCVVLQNAMDAAACPDSVNKLVILWLGTDTNDARSEGVENKETVQLLERFTKTENEKVNPPIYPKLRKILKVPSQLYYFMQFLRREKALHFLQFCFAVDEFNEKLLNPELAETQKEDLRNSAKKMFANFFDLNSGDVIYFDESVRTEMHQIVYGSDDIENLRKRDTLFRAYDFAFDILEMRYLPRYYRCYEFFQFISGSNNPSSSAKDSKSSKGRRGNNNSSWKNKIRTAMRTSAPGWPTLEGTILNAIAPKEDFDTAVDLTEVDFIQEDSEDSEPETSGSYGDLIPICGRDLSAWRVSIPRLTPSRDTSGKRLDCFEIDIQRIDLRPEDDPEEYHWSVLRSYNDFYALEAKLSEFHGQLFELRLPPKKIFGTRNPEFLESIRLDFQSFLKSLLQQPAFKSSDLIFAFLTLTDLSAAPVLSDGLFVSGNNFLPDLGFSRIIRHVPMKLRQERGQHLDNFLNTFVASTEPPKPKPSKSDPRESSEVSIPLFKKFHPLFQDNAATFCFDPSSLVKNQVSRNLPTLEGVYDCLLFLCLRIFPIPEPLWNILAGLQSLLSPFIDSFSLKRIGNKLKNAVKASRLVTLISLLKETVLEENVQTPRKAELLERRDTALKLLEQNVPSWMGYVIAQDQISERIQNVFQCFQIPILNKQLSYVLLDLLLRELYPEDFTH